MNRKDDFVRRARRAAGLCAVVAALAACDSAEVLAPGVVDEPAVLIFYNDTSRIVAPEIVDRGAAFEVSFVTFGGGCTREVARTKVSETSAVAEVRPYNRTTQSAGCTRDLLGLRHAVLMRVHRPGTYSIRVIGHQRGASTGNVNSPVELTRAVVIR